ncbi:sulfotransferase family 2 domain-containing protein [Prosthecomicrobium sp. N25]|uniref:sulfotransferase family 2 domain-containing protein n=1 Tax=Prosthecomicrobium sp. N25 TaxID=3129254 RepID=UPI003077961F
MIISHRHRFIYLKCRKVGSTSVEVALADLCGPEDVVTPLDGAKTRADGRRHVNWQNHDVPRDRWPLLARALVAAGVSKRAAGVEYFNHIRAARLRRLLGAEVFDGYLKVAIERNPWDREVSNFYFHHPKPEGRPSFEEFLRRHTRRKPIDNFDIYSIDGRVVADIVLRHERLDEDFAALMARLGIDPTPALPRARSHQRPDKGRYRDLYTTETRDLVARLYAREIRTFGYEF